MCVSLRKRFFSMHAVESVRKPECDVCKMIDRYGIPDISMTYCKHSESNTSANIDTFFLSFSFILFQTVTAIRGPFYLLKVCSDRMQGGAIACKVKKKTFRRLDANSSRVNLAHNLNTELCWGSYFVMLPLYCCTAKYFFFFMSKRRQYCWSSLVENWDAVDNNQFFLNFVWSSFA